MHKHYILCIDVANEVNDAFCIGMGWKGNIFNIHIHFILSMVDLKFPHPIQKFVAKSAWHAVPRYNKSVFRIPAPLFEDLQRCASMEHARGGE